MVDDVGGGGGIPAGQIEVPGDVVAGSGGNDAQRHTRCGDDVHSQVHHAVPTNDDQSLDPVARSVLKESLAGVTRLFIRTAAYMEDLVPGLT